VAVALKPPNPVLGVEKGLANRLDPVLAPVPNPPKPVDAVVCVPKAGLLLNNPPA